MLGMFVNYSDFSGEVAMLHINLHFANLKYKQ